MVAPVAFDFNPEAASDNAFINPIDVSTDESLSRLRREVRGQFSALYSSLIEAGVQVQLFARQEDDDTPDAVFPNNWFSTHTDYEV